MSPKYFLPTTFLLLCVMNPIIFQRGRRPDSSNGEPGRWLRLLRPPLPSPKALPQPPTLSENHDRVSLLLGWPYVRCEPNSRSVFIRDHFTPGVPLPRYVLEIIDLLSLSKYSDTL